MATIGNLGDQEIGAEYQTMFDQHTCTHRGMCPVTQIRHQQEPFESHSLYFEVHGNGPQKIVLIMGLNNTSFAWLSQVEHFGKLEHTLLSYYLLADYLGWTAERDLHIVELAYRIPERITSLSLLVTHAGGHPWQNIPSWKGCTSLARLLAITDREQKIPIAHDLTFSGRMYRRRFEITKPQTLMGSLGQMCSLLALLRITLSITRGAKISRVQMPEAEYQCWEKTGHAIPAQHKVRLNKLLERVFEEGKEAAGKRTDVN
ncbi:hypothetical protein BU15DRAFT_88398 [Melanogaster broomeanus]|nr:hypothetical protein BU15DRAFT_88398 [Melanogaster broomeanus]